MTRPIDPAISDKKPVVRLCCTGCGYDPHGTTATQKCPMCGGRVWDFVDWRPFTRSLEGRYRSARREVPRSPR